ncbi:MAG: L,D-transpeptidase family protein [Rhizobiales bacterium]|nr:L,D-transpeptidase family protein [Hyphomicrobiales bacterium]
MRLGIIATFVFILSLTGASFATTTDSSDATVPVIKPPAKPAASSTTTPTKPAAKPAATGKTTPAKPAAKPITTTTKATTTKPTTAKATKPASTTLSNVNKPASKKKVAAKPKEPYVVININKASQKMTVTVGGRQMYNWLVSTGAAGYTTPSGNFKPFRMEKDHFSKEWDDAPMPHAIFFTMEGHAIHGSPYTKRLGTRASHGCVRLSPQNAATLFELVQKAGMSNTRVIVRGGGFDFWTSSMDTSGIQPSRWIRKVDPLDQLNRMFDD